MPWTNGEPLQAVDRAIRVLLYLASDEARGESGVSDIAKGTGLPKATVHRLLRAFSPHRFVEQNPETGKYRLSWGVFEVGNKVPGVIGLKMAARPEMASLCEISRETVNLAVRDGTDAVLIDKVDSNQLLRLELEIGRREPLHATALGKALLCEFGKDALAGVFGPEPWPAVTPSTIQTLAGFAAALEAVRRDGYATDNEEFSVNIRCVGAPIRNHTHRVIAAISVSGPAHRFPADRAKEVAPAVVQAAKNISKLLGHG